MAIFSLHFFKEKSREISVESIIQYFKQYPDIEIISSDHQFTLVYRHPVLGHQGRFVFTPKSVVPNIYRLNPKYLNINFHFEVSLLLPYYVARHLFEVANKVADEFNFYTYNELFEDILSFRIDTIDKAYESLKQGYIERNPALLDEYHMMPKTKLSAILRYINDQVTLQTHYQDIHTHVPFYRFLLNKDQEVFTAIDWQDQTSIIFPPYLDYVTYRLDKGTKFISYAEIKEVLDEYLEDVPGFIRGTKVLMPNRVKKAHKKMKKYAFTNHEAAFTIGNYQSLLDN